MAKGKRKGGSRRRRKIPIIPTALFFGGLWQLYNDVKGKPNMGASAVLSLTGYNPVTGDFNWRDAKSGIPLIGSAVANKVISATGIRRGLNIPMFTI